MRFVYENLSQSIGDRVVYLRSTDVEQMNYERLLWSIPDEWFLKWYLEDTVVLHENTTKSNGGKIIRIFIPVLKDILNFIWYNKELQNKRLKAHYEKAFETLINNRSLYKKYMYWKDLIKEVRLETKFTKLDKELNLLRG